MTNQREIKNLEKEIYILMFFFFFNNRRKNRTTCFSNTDMPGFQVFAADGRLY